MTGKEHFDLAESIMQKLREDEGTVRDLGRTHKSLEYARAQVHATLALTMATLVGMEAADWEAS